MKTKSKTFANLAWKYIFFAAFYWEAGRLGVIKMEDKPNIYFAWQQPAYQKGDGILIWILKKNTEKIELAKIESEGGNVYKIFGESGNYGRPGTVVPRLIVGKVILKI